MYLYHSETENMADSAEASHLLNRWIWALSGPLEIPALPLPALCQLCVAARASAQYGLLLRHPSGLNVASASTPKLPLRQPSWVASLLLDLCAAWYISASLPMYSQPQIWISLVDLLLTSTASLFENSQQTAPHNFDLAQVLPLCVCFPIDPKPSFNTFSLKNQWLWSNL